MSIDNAQTQLDQVLTNDANIIAWANSNFSTTLKSVNGNRPLDLFNDADLPALVYELGDGNSDTQPGGFRAEIEHQIRFAFVWYEKDLAAAFNQRKSLPDIVVSAILANKTLNSSVENAAVDDWSFAQGASNPEMHSARFNLTVQYSVTK